MCTLDIGGESSLVTVDLECVKVVKSAAYLQRCILYLQLPWRDTNLEDEMSLVQSIVKTIRSIRQEYNLTKAKPEGIH